MSRHPWALGAVSGAIDVLQTVTIARLHRRHPKAARTWAVILLGAETFAVADNVRITSQIRRARASGR